MGLSLLSSLKQLIYIAIVFSGSIAIAFCQDEEGPVVEDVGGSELVQQEVQRDPSRLFGGDWVEPEEPPAVELDEAILMLAGDPEIRDVEVTGGESTLHLCKLSVLVCLSRFRSRVIGSSVGLSSSMQGAVAILVNISLGLARYVAEGPEDRAVLIDGERVSKGARDNPTGEVYVASLMRYAESIGIQPEVSRSVPRGACWH